MKNTNRTASLLRKTGSLVLSVALLGMIGCGGGGGDGPTPDAVPTGYYGNNGTARVLTEDGTTPIDITDLQGMIHDGRLIMLSAAQGLSYDGAITVSGNTYLGTLTAYRDGTKLTTAPVTGTIAQGVSMTGTLSGTGANNGSFTLNYAGNNGEAAALTVVGGSAARTWTAPIGGSTFDFRLETMTTGMIIDDAITSSGVFMGCRMAGSIAPINGTHLYAVSATLNRCTGTPPADGTYTGLATTRTQNPGTPNDRLFFAVTNGTFSFSNEFVPF